MTGLSWELTGCLLLFQALHAIVAGTIIALLLWYGKRMSARRGLEQGDPA